MALKSLLTLCWLGLVLASNNPSIPMQEAPMEEASSSPVRRLTGLVFRGCTELAGDVATLVGNSNAVTAWTSKVMSRMSTSAHQLQNVVFTVGNTCSGRRLDERRLQTTGTVTFEIHLTDDRAEVYARNIQRSWDRASVSNVQSWFQIGLAEEGVTVTDRITLPNGVGTLVMDATTTTTTTTISTTTTTGATTTRASEEEGGWQLSAAYQKSFTFGVLMALVPYMM